MSGRRRAASGARTLLQALGMALALMLGSGCGMYGDLMLEERPVRTPEIIELEPISAPTEPGDEDEEGRKHEDDPAGGS